MRARLAAVRVASALLSGSAAAQNTVERVTLKGAQDMIVVPKDWNGGLFIYAHRYTRWTPSSRRYARRTAAGYLQ